MELFKAFDLVPVSKKFTPSESLVFLHLKCQPKIYSKKWDKSGCSHLTQQIIMPASSKLSEGMKKLFCFEDAIEKCTNLNERVQTIHG